jgi:peptide/nickel transport system permease protein
MAEHPDANPCLNSTQSPSVETVVEAKRLLPRGVQTERGFVYVYWRQFRRHRLGMVGAALVGFLVLVAIAAPVLATHDYAEPNWDQTLAPPGTPNHILGTDDLGRDVYSRLIWGTRVSLLVAFVASGISAIIGSVVGSVSGYLAGRVDLVLSGVMDLTWSFPLILLALVLIAIIGPGLTSVLLAFALTVWALYARVARAEVLSLREREFILAARATGARTSRIIVHHLVPNVLPAILVIFSMMVGEALLVEAGLSYLGIGVQPPRPSWGAMISGGRDYIRTAPWLIALPGLAISIAVLGFNLLGDAIRDVVDPRLKER